MANDHVIEVEGRFVDNISNKADDAAEALKDIGDEAKKAQKETDKLSKKKIKPDVDANTNKFLKKIRQAEEKAKKFASSKTEKVIRAVDKASAVIDKVVRKAKDIAGKTWQGIVKAKDTASSILQKVSSLGKGIAGKAWTAMVKIKDMATTPLTKIKNALFSIKTLIGVIATGWAANQLIVNPINLADAYSSAKIGFQTLLGETQGQQMMNDLDAFAKATPFKSAEVISQSQRMIAMGWNAEDIIRDMTTIGDAAAATGKGEQGLQQIVTALAQIKSKGRLSTEELNQLAEAGIAAKRYIAEGLGYGSGDAGIAAMTKDLEKGAISSGAALEALMAGMKEYQGMMETTANETAEGLWSQITDTFEINIFRRWGQGLQDGAKRGFGTVLDLLNSSEGALESFGDTVYEIGKELSNWAADKLEKAVKAVKEITGSAEFKNASLGGKVKMLWDGVVGNPLAEWWNGTVIPWWNSTAVPWLAERAASMGKTIGEGLTSGLLTLFGASDTLIDGAEQGANVASSFVEGFTEGFDGGAITEAIVGAIDDVWDALPWWAKILVGGKVAAKGIGTVNGAVGGLKTFGGIAGKAIGSAAAGTGLFGFGANTAIALGAGNLAGGASLGAGALTALGLGSVAGGIGGVLGIGDGIIDIYNGTQTTGKKKQDNYFKGGTKLGMVGAGAAAGAGIGSVVPGVGTVVGGLIGAGVGGLGAIFGGDKAGKWLSDKKDSVSEWFKKKYYGDAYDSETGKVDKGWMGETGGWLDTVNKAKTFFTETIPEKWDEFWSGVTDFFTETIPEAWDSLSEAVTEFFTETVPEKWDEFWSGVSDFFTETIPDAWDRLTEKVSEFFTETIPEKWNEFWTGVEEFFTETVPYALGYATGKVYAFFTETIPEKWDEFWDAVSEFFTETIPEWAEGIWNNHIVPFFSETIPEFFGTLWDTVTEFFTETIPEWAENIWDNHIVPFFTETIPGFFASLWSTITEFFTETIPEWAEGIWNNHIVPFFTETIPNFFSSLWNTITEFFTETIPQWAENVWNNNIVPFFTETVPGFFSQLWDSITGFFTETLPEFAESVWSPISTFFSETIPGWISSIWDKVSGWFSGIKDNFLSGFSAGSGGKGGKARGGIVGGGSTGLQAFARGGRSDGGIVGGTTKFIRVNEEAPEMVIPLSSQRKDRALKLWMKTGELLGADRFFRGGRTSGSRGGGFSVRDFDSDHESTSGQPVHIDIGGITIEIHVDARGSEDVVEQIKAKAKEIAEDLAGYFADALEGEFENTPLRA